MKFSVRMIAVNTATGRVIRKGNKPFIQTEEIDTDTNELFTDLRHPWDIADRVEQFWNRLNPHDEFNHGNCTHPDEKVVVLEVRQLTGEKLRRTKQASLFDPTRLREIRYGVR